VFVPCIISAPSENGTFETTLYVHRVCFWIRQTATNLKETSTLPLKQETIKPQCLIFWFSKLESGVVSVKDAEYSEKLPSSTTYRNVAQIM
jgi:hypothetical protein